MQPQQYSQVMRARITRMQALADDDQWDDVIRRSGPAALPWLNGGKGTLGQIMSSVNRDL